GLAGGRVELARRVERAASALEEEVGAFPPRELATGSDITCHGVLLIRFVCRASAGPALHAAPLGRAATVVRNGGDVRDRNDLEAERIQRAHRRLAARSRSLDAHFEVLHAVLLGCAAGGLRRDLRGKGR